MSRIRGVLLDLGETLVHLANPWEEVFEAEVRALYAYLNDAGVKTDFQKFSTAFVSAFDDATSRANLYRIEIPMDEIIARVIGKFGVRNPYQGFIQGAVEEYYRPEIASWQLFPDTMEALTNLEKNGYLLGLISNAKSAWQVNSILRKFDLSRFFKVTLISASLRMRKPRPDVFLNALDKLSLTPRETVFIGNSIDADVIGSRSVGMRAIHLRREPPDRDLIVDPDATVSSLSDAVNVVNDWAIT
jgi:HAD superfamily hydrolase (TIGR01662 family)